MVRSPLPKTLSSALAMLLVVAIASPSRAAPDVAPSDDPPLRDDAPASDDASDDAPASDGNPAASGDAPRASESPADRPPVSAPSDDDASPPERNDTQRPPLVRVPVDLALWHTASINRLLAERPHNLVGIGLGSTMAARVTGLQISLGLAAVEEAALGLQVAGLVAAAGERITGLQLAGLVGASGGHVTGFQIAGLVSGAGGEARGLQLGGLVAASGGEARGIQVGGLVAGAGGALDGIQVGGAVAGSSKRTRGIQVAGLVAGTGGELRGLQLALFMAGASALRGAQLAGGLAGTGQLTGAQIAAGAALAKRGRGLQLATAAIVDRELSGVQLALVNIGGEITGAQIGLVNIARSVRGAQIGLVNVAKSIDGAPIGAFSYVNGAPRGPEVWLDSSGGLWAGYRSGVPGVYSLLAAGGAPVTGGTPLWVGAGGGVRLPVDLVLAIEPDLLLAYARLDVDDGGSALRAALRLKIAYRLSGIELLAGLAAEAARSSGDTDGLVVGPSVTAGDGDTRWRVWPSVFAGARL